MPRYFLQHPNNPQQILIKHGQSGFAPIYWGRGSNDFFILKLNRNFIRFLYPYDSRIGVVGILEIPVPDNWSGDPQVVFDLDEDLWERTEPTRIREWLLPYLIDGDFIRLTKDGQPTGFLRATYKGRDVDVERFDHW